MSSKHETLPHLLGLQAHGGQPQRLIVPLSHQGQQACCRRIHGRTQLLQARAAGACCAEQGQHSIVDRGGERGLRSVLAGGGRFVWEATCAREGDMRLQEGMGVMLVGGDGEMTKVQCIDECFCLQMLAGKLGAGEVTYPGRSMKQAQVVMMADAKLHDMHA